MENREDDKLVDPIDRRPSQVYILCKILSDFTDLLIVIWPEVEFELCFSFCYLFRWYEQLYVSPLDDAGIACINGCFHFSTRKVIVRYDGRKKEFFFYSNPSKWTCKHLRLSVGRALI